MGHVHEEECDASFSIFYHKQVMILCFENKKKEWKEYDWLGEFGLKKKKKGIKESFKRELGFRKNDGKLEQRKWVLEGERIRAH